MHQDYDGPEAHPDDDHAECRAECERIQQALAGERELTALLVCDVDKTRADHVATLNRGARLTEQLAVALERVRKQALSHAGEMAELETDRNAANKRAERLERKAESMRAVLDAVDGVLAGYGVHHASRALGIDALVTSLHVAETERLEKSAADLGKLHMGTLGELAAANKRAELAEAAARDCGACGTPPLYRPRCKAVHDLETAEGEVARTNAELDKTKAHNGVLERSWRKSEAEVKRLGAMVDDELPELRGRIERLEGIR